MGSYLNTSCYSFKQILNNRIYVDKTALLDLLNHSLSSDDAYICDSRPRRFGKSTTAKMICAYYGEDQDASSLFATLKIGSFPSFREHLNKYHTIFINITDELNDAHGDVVRMISSVTSSINQELKERFPEVIFKKTDSLKQSFDDVFNKTLRQFVFVIDEWDSVLRELKEDQKSIKIYLEWLKVLFKDKAYVALAYMTGILPIKKYGTQSALNMFNEYSMLDPLAFAPFIGFTKKETFALCEAFNTDKAQIENWYDGYQFKHAGHIFNPNSVVKAIKNQSIQNYWGKTDTFELLRDFISLNFDGLRDSIVKLVAGQSIAIDISSFSNDMTSFNNQDDVLCLLVHLGYLSLEVNQDDVFAVERQSLVHIPNLEIKEEFLKSLKACDKFHGVFELIARSRKLLDDIFKLNCQAVAKAFDKAHSEHSSILKYNDENSLACVVALSLLYCTADLYSVKRELPAGKGFADLIYLPKNKLKSKPQIPALLIELKYDKSAASALSQITETHYTDFFEGFKEEVLLVGINYDKQSKEHECLIERMKL